ncbi:histidine kinase [Nonomuraea sp. NPDC048882]|uniref:sensor histidine kinase n=1 Tax=Nonomuraea sp. NPDC048882 TaxID=3154347 RepID=UPI0033D60923
MKAWDRIRNSSKLTRVRWLIVYCTDIILFFPLFGYYAFYLNWQQGMPPLAVLGGVVVLLAFNVLSTRPFRIAVQGGRRPTVVLAVTGVLAVALLVIFAQIWAIPTWLGLLAPFVRKRVAIVVAFASIVLANLFVWWIGGWIISLLILVQTVFTVICLAVVWANLALWRLTTEAHEGEEALARLAVSEERLRFARDLNDLLGQSLADVARRTERAEGALASDRDAAAAEMFEVRDLARRSLREVRAAVQNYRAIDLDEVLASVRAVLEAAGVRCTVRADTGALPPETRTLLATVVREGVTNVLKHSRAERCTITIEDGVLEMSNDGVSGPAGEHAPNGLAGLAQRVRAAGGTLEAEPTADGRYRLRAAVPA